MSYNVNKASHYVQSDHSHAMRDDNTTNCDENIYNDFMPKYQTQNHINDDSLIRTSSRGRFFSADQAEGEQNVTAKSLIESQYRVTNFHELSDIHKTTEAYKHMTEKQHQEEYSFTLDDYLSDIARQKFPT